jgi:hypothetical protein
MWNGSGFDVNQIGQNALWSCQPSREEKARMHPTMGYGNSGWLWIVLGKPVA